MNEYPKILKENEKKQDFNNNFRFGNNGINNKNSYIKMKENKFAQNDIYFNNYNENFLYEQATESFNNKNNNLDNYFKRHSENLSKYVNNKNYFDNKDSNKEIIYNFGYKKGERLEPLKLSLIKDTLNLQKHRDQNKNREKEVLKNQDKIKNNHSELNNINVINGKKSLHQKINNSVNHKKDEYLSKMVEQELYVTNSQMNMLDKEVNKIYNNYKNKMKDKNKFLKINEYLRYHRFLSNQDIRIIKNNRNDYEKNKNKFHVNSKNDIKLPNKLLMPYKIGENVNNNSNNYYNNKKQNYILSPLAQKGIHFFQNINNKYKFNNNIEGKKLKKNYSQIFEGKKYMIS